MMNICIRILVNCSGLNAKKVIGLTIWSATSVKSLVKERKSINNVRQRLVLVLISWRYSLILLKISVVL